MLNSKFTTHKYYEGGRDSRHLILAVALKLFTQNGYDGTSIDDIRQAAGFKSKASLYTHFKSKEDMSEALMTRILAQIREATLKAYYAADNEPLVKFVATGRALIEWGLTHPQEYAFRFIRVQQEKMISGQYCHLATQPEALYPKMLNVLQQLRTHYPVRQIADAALLSMMMGLISKAVIDCDSFGSISSKDRVDQIVEMCMGILFSEPVQIPKA